MQKAILENKPVFAFDIDTINESRFILHSMDNKVICPYCNQPLIFLTGGERLPHFAHKVKNEECMYYKLQRNNAYLMEEVQSDIVYQLRGIYPDVDFDINIINNDEFIDIYGNCEEGYISIKLFSDSRELLQTKSKALKILVTRHDVIDIPYAKLINDVLIYNINSKIVHLIKVEHLPFGVYEKMCHLYDLIIDPNNVVDVNEFVGNDKLYPYEKKDTKNNKSKSSLETYSGNNKPERIESKSLNEQYPNLYMYLSDVENGTLSDLEEVVEKLSYYLRLLLQDRVVYFKYSNYVRTDKFTNSDFYTVVKKMFKQMALKNSKFSGVMDKILKEAEII